MEFDGLTIIEETPNTGRFVETLVQLVPPLVDFHIPPLAEPAQTLLELLGSTSTPVSYTHLDVYKRQPLCRGGLQVSPAVITSYQVIRRFESNSLSILLFAGQFRFQSSINTHRELND